MEELRERRRGHDLMESYLFTGLLPTFVSVANCYRGRTGALGVGEGRVQGYRLRGWQFAAREMTLIREVAATSTGEGRKEPANAISQLVGWTRALAR